MNELVDILPQQIMINRLFDPLRFKREYNIWDD
jgi:hypothetical protein